MDCQKWIDCKWENLDAYKEFEQEYLAAVEAAAAASGMKVVKTLPNNWQFGAVVANADVTKWIHVTTEDVRQSDSWLKNIKLRRMSSERDWKGEEFHYCELEGLSAALSEYMSDKYDDEIL